LKTAATTIAPPRARDSTLDCVRDHARLEALCAAVSANPDREIEAFLKEAELAAAGLPAELDQALRDFRLDGNRDGFLLLRGFPIARPRDAETYLVNRARADALFDLGQKELYEKKNHVRACVLYREAGGLGHVGAQNQLGLCFASGNGMPKDEVEAYGWFRRAAEGGNAIAQYNVSHAFAVGAGISRDYPSAVVWARKSAEQGYPKGICRLGLLYREGEGVEADAAQSAKLFRQGADKGDEWCMALLAEAYEKGTGVAKDVRQARLWYTRAAAKGYEAAKARLKDLK